MTKKETEKQLTDKLGLSDKDQLKDEELDNFTAETGAKIKALRDKIHEQIVGNDTVVEQIIADSDRILKEKRERREQKPDIQSDVELEDNLEAAVVVKGGLTRWVGTAKKDKAALRNLVFRRDYLEKFVGEPDEAAIEEKTAEFVKLFSGKKDPRNPLLVISESEVRANRTNPDWVDKQDISDTEKTKARELQGEILALTLKGNLPRQILTDYDQLKSEVDKLRSQYYYLIDQYAGRGASINKTKQESVIRALMEKSYDFDPDIEESNFAGLVLTTAAGYNRKAKLKVSGGKDWKIKAWDEALQRLANKGNPKPTFDELFVEYKRFYLEKTHKEAKTPAAALLTEEVRNELIARLKESLKETPNKAADYKFSLVDVITELTGKTKKEFATGVMDHISTTAKSLKDMLAENESLKTDSLDENVGHDSKTT